MNKKGKAQRGITLIALVITIIVMLILVAVTISMAVNGGLFNYAGKAVGETKNALNAENELANGGVKVGDVWYNSIDEYLATKNLGTGTEEPVGPISKTDSYVGYYADVDGNGTADGVIYADLAVGGSGSWGGQSYSYNPATGVKDYYVNGTADGPFGNGIEVLTATGEGTDRFYVMALSDISISGCTWYSRYGSTALPLNSGTDLNQGYHNTATMIEIWNGDTDESKSSNDVWGQIQTQVNNGWFLPSKDEWLAFGDSLDISHDSTSETYFGNYGLKNGYWTSSWIPGDYDTCIWTVILNSDESIVIASDYPANLTSYARLSTTY